MRVAGIGTTTLKMQSVQHALVEAKQHLDPPQHIEDSRLAVADSQPLEFTNTVSG